MCGITGIFHRHGNAVNIDVLNSMTDSLVHRGPDARGIWVDHNIGLGHRRLAIRDPGNAGKQPMTDQRHIIHSVFNGEIYNDRELRKQLEKDFGFVFVSQCDAELIPAGYLVWGLELFNRIEGMFAIALWDSRKRELVLARDGVGIKPLFVSVDNDTARFGSELKALLADPQQSRSIRPESIPAYMVQGYVSPTKTLLDSVEQIAPGTIRVIGKDRTQDHKFWQPTRYPRISNIETAIDEFLPLWDRVVSDLLVSDVPVGVQQSGGIDSTLVTMTVCKGRRIPAFTACLAEATHNELELAKQAVSSTGADHKLIHIDEHYDAAEIFRFVVDHFDGQLADSSAFAVYQLNRQIRQSVKVVLSGDGADEFFAGYPTYRASRIANVVGRICPRVLAALFERMMFSVSKADENRLPIGDVAARFFRGLQAPSGTSHAYWRSLVGLDVLSNILGSELRAFTRENNPYQDYIDALRGTDGPLAARCMLADQRFYLPSDMLMKVDAMSMAHGLEVRVPFLDRRIVEFAGSLDIRMLTPMQGPDKKILRRVLDRIGAPKEISSGTKRGFNVPVARLLRTGLRGLGNDLLINHVGRLEPYFDPAGVMDLWNEHCERRANHGYALWCLLTFAVWKQQLDGCS